MAEKVFFILQNMRKEDTGFNAPPSLARVCGRALCDGVLVPLAYQKVQIS